MVPRRGRHGADRRHLPPHARAADPGGDGRRPDQPRAGAAHHAVVHLPGRATSRWWRSSGCCSRPAWRRAASPTATRRSPTCRSAPARRGAALRSSTPPRRRRSPRAARLRLVPAPGEAEPYLARGPSPAPSAASSSRRSRKRPCATRFYATQGTFSPGGHVDLALAPAQRSGRRDRDPPTKRPPRCRRTRAAEVYLFVVVRDERGGSSFIRWRLTLQPLGPRPMSERSGVEGPSSRSTGPWAAW